MFNKTLITFILLVQFFFYQFNILYSLEVKNILKDPLSKIEIASKGKNLENFFKGNTLELLIDDQSYIYQFKDSDYEILQNNSIIEKGNWKISGVIKNQITLEAKDKTRKYYFKKINNKPIIYSYNKAPGMSEANKKEIKVLSSKNVENLEEEQIAQDKPSSIESDLNKNKEEEKIIAKKEDKTDNKDTSAKQKEKFSLSKLTGSIDNLNKGIQKVLGQDTGTTNTVPNDTTTNATAVQAQLKKYNATSNISYYFFEAMENYLHALELLYRAYDNNVEADKITSAIDYLKSSKSSEKDKLTSTKKLFGTVSIGIQANLEDASLLLNEKGMSYYNQALPFAVGAAQSTIYLYQSSKNSINTFTSTSAGGSVTDTLLSNANDIGAAFIIVPEIPDFSKNMFQTVKMILEGARAKGIRDNGKYSDALNKLKLPEFNALENNSNKKENKLTANKKTSSDEIEKKTEPLVKKEEKKELKQNIDEKTTTSTSSPKVVSSKQINTSDQRKILKYVCDPNKSEYYWGENKNNLKLSRYEDSPYQMDQRARSEKAGSNEDLSGELLWSITEIDLERGYVYESGMTTYDANGDGKLDTMPYAERRKIIESNKNLLKTETEYKLKGKENPAYENTEELNFEIEYSVDSITYYRFENWSFLRDYGETPPYPNYWEKFVSECIQTTYTVSKESGDEVIKSFMETKPLADKAEKDLFNDFENVQNQAQAQTNAIFKESNEEILKQIFKNEDQYKNISKNTNQNTNVIDESKKLTGQVSKEQLKTYKASSAITYFFFESQSNYLSSLELLYRAYDKNVDADKMKAQISYLKDSRIAESKRLKSTTEIIDQASEILKKDIGNEKAKLSDEAKDFYQKSLPFAYKATEYGYKVFVVSSAVGKDLSNSKDKVGSILINFNEIIGFASIVPKIPGYVTTIGSTSKLIFTGAKSKEIKDTDNLGKALDDLKLPI